MMIKNVARFIARVLDGRPGVLTAMQSALVTVLASLMSASLYLVVGVHFPGVAYQIIAALTIAAILAPIFLYPAFRQASRLQDANVAIKALAFTDRLTQLPNSFALANEVEGRIERHPNAPLAIHIFDLDRFKEVNDGIGFDVGDALLVEIARTLRSALRQGEYLARLGADQFVVLQPLAGHGSAAFDQAKDVLRHLSRRYEVMGHQLVMTASAGTALYPLHGSEGKQVLSAANLALSRAKTTGLPWIMFESSLARAATTRRDIEVGLREALQNAELSLAYQPIVRADDPQKIVVAEALVRWTMPDGRQVPPAEFIPVAERTGLIGEIGSWVLRKACEECVTWPANVRVAVNVSAAQLKQGNFVETVRATLAAAGLPANRLELEITETMLMSDTNISAPILNELRSLGIRIALDDFGSGFCGLNYLRRFTIDKIKVDKSIIDDAIVDEKSANILRGVSKIAAEMGMTVTVEGVDTIEKADLILQENCADELQGFLYSRPVSADDLRKTLANFVPPVSTNIVAIGRGRATQS